MRRPRLFIALAVILVGVSLLPLVGLASQPFGWQQYADAYQLDEFIYLPILLRR
jgi:hypothetical protein